MNLIIEAWFDNKGRMHRKRGPAQILSFWSWHVNAGPHPLKRSGNPWVFKEWYKKGKCTKRIEYRTGFPILSNNVTKIATLNLTYNSLVMSYKRGRIIRITYFNK